jgi:hypothetical protein
MHTPDKNELDALAERITHARILREHHVWEAVRGLSIDVRAGRCDGPWRFVELMEADAMLDAVMLLTTLPEEGRSIASIRNAGGRWTCTVRSPPGAGRKTAGMARAEHTDLAAAILTSFILSHARPGRGSGRQISSRRDKNRRPAS